MREINSDVEEISLRTTPPVVRDILLSHFQIILLLLNSQVPLELFYHNRQALQSKLDEELKAEPMDKNLVADLTVATSFAEEEHTAAITSLEHLLASGEITWELLWTIFPPNVLVYRYHPLVEEDQIMKLRAMRQAKRIDKSRYWDFDCHVVGDDGIKFGLAYEPFSMEIDEFTGTRKITDLRIYPLQYHVRAAELSQIALERGRRFAKLSEPRVMQTSGSAMAEKRDARWQPYAYKFKSNRRAIIDPAGYRTFNPNGTNFMPDIHRRLSREELTNEQLIICAPIAFGFSFGNKKWGTYSTSTN
jgi:hypothetical protein